MAAPYKWKVEEPPTGDFRSFHYRGWPAAVYKNDAQDLCGDIQCPDSYQPFMARAGSHKPLTVRVCDHSVRPYKFITLDGAHATLELAKTALKGYIEANPAVMPGDVRPPSQIETILPPARKRLKI